MRKPEFLHVKGINRRLLTLYHSKSLSLSPSFAHASHLQTDLRSLTDSLKFDYIKFDYITAKRNQYVFMFKQTFGVDVCFMRLLATYLMFTPLITTAYIHICILLLGQGHGKIKNVR